MTPPRLDACYFNWPHDARWARMARVLEWSARSACPTWQVQVQAITPLPSSGIRKFVHNTRKLEHWAARVADAVDGDRLLLMDADMAILRPLEDVWDRPFDVAYTVRPKRFPINGGVVFLRISDRVRQFVIDWTRENRRLLEEPTGTYPWAKEYGGINQASLIGLLPECAARGIATLELPCAEWNCEDTTWTKFDPAVTRILHVKSDLRNAIFAGHHVSPALDPLVRTWKQLDAIATQHARTA